MKTNIILQGDALTKLKELPDESINCIMTSPPYWALRDYGTDVETIWEGDADFKNCEHEWENGFPAGDKRITKRSESRAGWERPSREEFSKRSIKNVCPVCKEEFEGKPGQKFCSKKCLNTLSNEERTNMQQKSNFCQKCGAWKGQLGLEPTFDSYIKHLCDIFDEVKRVLRKDGTCWVNLGDTYSGNKEGKTDNKVSSYLKDNSNGIKKKVVGVPEKSLSMIPMRFAIEMVNRGWILRNNIIWQKPNCMPSSVKDRFTVDFEYVFFFVKSKKYWFETQYVPVKQNSIDRLNRAVSNKNKWKDGPDGQTKHTMNQPRLNKHKRYNKSLAPHEFEFGDNMVSPFNPEKGRNKRTVWSICPRPFKEAHFAVYPEKLCETPIKAGCPEGGIVIDPFFGAGTTGLVALKQNKKFIGIELNPEYVEIAKKRLKPYLEQTKLFAKTARNEQ